jgi:hypothetical protein
MPRSDGAPESSFSTHVGTGEVLPVGGGYRLLKRLGQGAFGEVWRAEAPGGVAVAVKLISRTVKPEEARRELEALEIIKGLRQHYLLSLQAYFSLPDRLIIVLELADTSLRARLRECERIGQGLPPADLLRYTLEAAEALDYLHEQKVQHRDIKPDMRGGFLVAPLETAPGASTRSRDAPCEHSRGLCPGCRVLGWRECLTRRRKAPGTHPAP